MFAIKPAWGKPTCAIYIYLESMCTVSVRRLHQSLCGQWVLHKLFYRKVRVELFAGSYITQLHIRKSFFGGCKVIII